MRKRDIAFMVAVALAALAAVWLMVDMPIAMGFPEEIHHGYSSCEACHISPSGGGMLTPYGRGASEALSMWAEEGEGAPGHGLAPKLPAWLSLGGDGRLVELETVSEPSGLRSQRWVPMQDDIEAAVAIEPYLGLVPLNKRSSSIRYGNALPAATRYSAVSLSQMSGCSMQTLPWLSSIRLESKRSVTFRGKHGPAAADLYYFSKASMLATSTKGRLVYAPPGPSGRVVLILRRMHSSQHWPSSAKGPTCF